MTPNGFFRVCQNEEGPTFVRALLEIKQLLIPYYINQKSGTRDDSRVCH